MATNRCYCACHQYPGTYPPPCGFCGHDTREGRWVGGYRGWWEPNADPRDDEITRLTAQLAALEAERDALRGWQAGQTHYVGCWREHRRCALTTIDFEAARREHAELALREAVAELNRLREGQDDERR